MRWRQGSLALSASIRSTGSRQPRATNGSRHHSAQVSKLPRGLPRMAQLGVFATSIEFAKKEPAAEIFADGQAVARHHHECSAVERPRAGLTEQANPGGALRQYRSKRIGLERDSVGVVEEQGRLSLNQFGGKSLVEFLALAAHRERAKPHAKGDGANGASQQALAAACSRHR